MVLPHTISVTTLPQAVEAPQPSVMNLLSMILSPSSCRCICMVSPQGPVILAAPSGLFNPPTFFGLYASLSVLSVYISRSSFFIRSSILSISSSKSENSRSSIFIPSLFLLFIPITVHLIYQYNCFSGTYFHTSTTIASIISIIVVTFAIVYSCFFACYFNCVRLTHLRTFPTTSAQFLFDYGNCHFQMIK